MAYKTYIFIYTFFTINKQRIEAKIKEPTSIASLEDTDSLLIEIGTIIDGFNKKIKANNDIVGDLKTKKVKCKQEVWEYLADYLKADVADYRAKVVALDKEIGGLQKDMEQLKKDGFDLKEQANALNKKIVNTEAQLKVSTSFLIILALRVSACMRKSVWQTHTRSFDQMEVWRKN